MADPATTAIVLVCALSMPADQCTDKTALYRAEIPMICSKVNPQFNPSPMLPPRNEAALKDWHYYFKTRCT